MPDTLVVACKFKQEFEPSRRRKQSKNGQGTYQILVNNQLGRRVDQTRGILSKVIVSISKRQTLYTTPIMMTQANTFVGWPPPIPINNEELDGVSKGRGSNSQALLISFEISRL
jgi:hypothetical protein